jgi:hypothetical protein
VPDRQSEIKTEGCCHWNTGVLFCLCCRLRREPPLRNWPFDSLLKLVDYLSHIGYAFCQVLHRFALRLRIDFARKGDYAILHVVLHVIIKPMADPANCESGPKRPEIYFPLNSPKASQNPGYSTKKRTIQLISRFFPSGHVSLTDTSLSLVLDEGFHRVCNVEKRNTWSRNSSDQTDNRVSDF